LLCRGASCCDSHRFRVASTVSACLGNICVAVQICELTTSVFCRSRAFGRMISPRVVSMCFTGGLGWPRGGCAMLILFSLMAISTVAVGYLHCRGGLYTLLCHCHRQSRAESNKSRTSPPGCAEDPVLWIPMVCAPFGSKFLVEHHVCNTAQRIPVWCAFHVRQK